MIALNEHEDEQGTWVERLLLDVAQQAAMQVRTEAMRQEFLNAMADADWEGLLASASQRLQERRAAYLQNFLSGIVQCVQCAQQLPRRDRASMDGLPLVVQAGDYCKPCGEKVRADYTHICLLCDAHYLAAKSGEAVHLCSECQTPTRLREGRRVLDQCQRAEDVDLPATLTLKEWLTTLDAFGWQCAYCQTKAMACMEHFVPINLGGGTTVANCVPACQSCNSWKGYRHPSQIGDPELAAALARVQAYLATRVN